MLLSLVNKFIYNEQNLLILKNYIDLTKKRLGMKKKPQLLLDKINKEEIKGIPYLHYTNNNIPFLMKVFPNEQDKKLDNSFIEIAYLDLFNKELLHTCISPNFPYLYNYYCQVPIESKSLSHIPFKKLKQITELDNVCNILVCEFFKDRDIDTWYYNFNNITNKHWKSIIFQICYTLSVLQDKYKFMHNDLHPGNILIDHVSKERDLCFEFNRQTFYLKNTGFIPKIWDFEFSNIFDENYIIYYNPVVFDFKYNEGYDIHKFLKGILQIVDLPREVINFVEDLYPKELLYTLDDKGKKKRVNISDNTKYLQDGILTLEALKDFSLPTPKMLLDNDYFNEYKTNENVSDVLIKFSYSRKI